jgi:hypothetical protein
MYLATIVSKDPSLNDPSFGNRRPQDPNCTDYVGSPTSQKLWPSMAKELQFLSGTITSLDTTQGYRNTVASSPYPYSKIIGVCWVSLSIADATIMPVLIPRRAKFGKTASFLERHGNISLQKILDLCLDIRPSTSTFATQAKDYSGDGTCLYSTAPRTSGLYRKRRRKPKTWKTSQEPTKFRCCFPIVNYRSTGIFRS